MQLFDIAFYVFACVTLLSACVVVFSRNIVLSAFSLLFTFSGVAGLYVLLSADFIAVTQLLVYVGGILVLIMSGVMLTSKAVSVDIKTSVLQTLPATILVAVLAATLCGIFWMTKWRQIQTPDIKATASHIGNAFLSAYLLPFEVASVILLVALVGAVMIARREKKV